VQQVAAAVQQTGAAANAAAPPQRNLAERLLKIIKVSSAAGLAIFGLVKAYRDLGAVSQTALRPKCRMWARACVIALAAPVPASWRWWRPWWRRLGQASRR
ncbi:hypothetical protein, partial [Verrucomicrobium spinosum]|uniref:hypothetical protein n=1 Tax=Verrucomicrobium spinosum TaxID=2736 RepID=UPI000ABB73DA